MLPEFLDPQSLSTAQSETSRRKELRTKFGRLVVNATGWYEPKLFREENLPALADVLDDLTPDEIAFFILELVRVVEAQS